MSVVTPFAAGAVLTAAQLNGFLAAWDTYTPVWTSTGSAPAVGTGGGAGTLVGHSLQVGKHVDFWLSLTIGSGTTVGTGQYQFTVPVPPYIGHPCHFDVVFYDSSAATFYRGVTIQPSGSRVSLAYDSGGLLSAMGAAAPAAVAAGDVLEISGTYEAA